MRRAKADGQPNYFITKADKELTVSERGKQVTTELIRNHLIKEE